MRIPKWCHLVTHKLNCGVKNENAKRGEGRSDTIDILINFHVLSYEHKKRRDGGRILETRRDAMCRRAEEMAGGIGREGGRRRWRSQGELLGDWATLISYLEGLSTIIYMEDKMIVHKNSIDYRPVGGLEPPSTPGSAAARGGINGAVKREG